MSKMRVGRAIVILAASGLFPLAALADEIVHFTNGAEMTVRSHVVDKEKQMVRLDLGSNSFIAFPMAMVDKIVNAGRDVYLNPTFHPANQAIEGVAGLAPDNSIKGVPESTNHARQGSINRGEGAAKPIPSVNTQAFEQQMMNSRRVFDPANPPKAGERPQVVMLKGMTPGKAPQMSPIIAPPPEPAPPQPTPPPEPQPQAQENPPAGEQPDSENPPDAP